MFKFYINAISFKKMEYPVNKNNGHVKYVCYVQVKSIPNEFDN